MNAVTESFGIWRADGGTEVALAMESLWLSGRVLPAGARLTVVHTFRSAEAGPLEVVYAFGLPRDAALRRFKIVGEGFQVRSDLRPVEEARLVYEQGLEAGHLAALVRNYRDGRVNLSVGNVRPAETIKVFLELVAGVDLRDDGLRFRFPFTLAPCYHACARAVQVEPGVGEQELPREEFDDLLLPAWLTEADGLHQVSFDLRIALPDTVTEVASPSHPVRVRGVGTCEAGVSLARAGDVPNRDLVLDARTKSTASRVFGGWDARGQGCFTAVVPSTGFGTSPSGPRRVLFLLDRSGSMDGQPLAQARRGLSACLATLSESDRFTLLAFDNQVDRFTAGLVPATAENRHAAETFLRGIDARGGTELGLGLQESLRLLAREPGDIVLLTDGQVSATEAILARVRPAGVRLHCLGIGSASQDRFLALLARETGGVSRFVTPGERVDLEALELFASIGRPVATDVTARLEGGAGGRLLGSLARQVFAGHPLVIMGQTDALGLSRLVLQWQTQGATKELALETQLEASPDASTVRLLQGARLITDLDGQFDGEVALRPADALASERILKQLEELGRGYGLANRALSLVAVVERADDVAGQVPHTRVVPVGLPEAVRFASYFGRTAAHYVGAVASPALSCLGNGALAESEASYSPAEAHAPRAMHVAFSPMPFARKRPAPPPTGPEDVLMEWAAKLAPDGGLPGDSAEQRVLRSLALLACFLAAGHTLNTGAFRDHVRLLVQFLEQSGRIAPDSPCRSLAEPLREAAAKDRPLPASLFDEAMRGLSKPDARWRRRLERHLSTVAPQVDS